MAAVERGGIFLPVGGIGVVTEQVGEEMLDAGTHAFTGAGIGTGARGGAGDAAGRHVLGGALFAQAQRAAVEPRSKQFIHGALCIGAVVEYSDQRM
jgi:hypothetical protein